MWRWGYAAYARVLYIDAVGDDTCCRLDVVETMDGVADRCLALASRGNERSVQCGSSCVEVIELSG